MSTVLPMGGQRTILENLNSREYEHPLDKQALESLEHTPGLPVVVKTLNQYGIDRILRLQYAGSHFQVTERNMPEVYGILLEACEVLSVTTIPDFYVQFEDQINACTMGVEHNLVSVTSGCIDNLGKDELMYILGHELGHIKSQHVMYHQMAEVLPVIGDVVGQVTLGIGGLISTGIEIALMNWHRMSEFSADRAGLLASRNVDAVVTCMMKIAGLPPSYHDKVKPEHFIDQARHFVGLDDMADKIWKVVSVMGASHPWTVMRGSELIKWIDTGDFDRVCRRESAAVSNDMHKAFCTSCGRQAQPGEKFCSACGRPL